MTTITSNNRVLLMVGEFKSVQLFVEKAKLANNLYLENLNHLSWRKSPSNYVQKIISKKKKKEKKTIDSNHNYSLMLGEL